MNPRALLLLACLPACSAHAALSYVVPGSLVTQDFNSLPLSGTAGWVNDNTLPGWHWVGSAGTTPTVAAASSGDTPAQNQILSLGSAASTDRALGSQSPNEFVPPIRIGFQVANATGAELRSFALNYSGEQWRTIQGDAADSLTVEYQFFDAGAGSLGAASGWTALPSLTFTTPILSVAPAVSRGIDGNLAANRVFLQANVTNLTWAAGRELWVRWSDAPVVSGSSRRHMMGVDDLTFAASTSPTITPLPVLGAASPDATARTLTRTVTLSGSSFVAGATVTPVPANPGLTVTNVVVNSSTQAQFTLVADASATLGPQGFRLTNPDGNYSEKAALVTVLDTPGPVAYAAADSAYTQDFNALPTSGANRAWINGASVPGWHALAENGADRATITATDGASPFPGLLLNLGKAGVGPVGDRALASQNANAPGATVNARLGVGLVNQTGQDLNSFQLSYTGELWRLPGNPHGGDQLVFEYRVTDAGAGGLGATGWTRATALDFVSPATGNTGAAIAYDGNNPATPPGNHAALSSRVTVAWAAGRELWLRWSDENDLSDLHKHILAVDDVVFSASTTIPAPRLSASTPTHVHAGAPVELVLSGAALQAGAALTVTPPDPGIVITNAVVESAETLRVALVLAPDAPAGPRGFTVTNPDLQSFATNHLFDVVGPLEITEKAPGPAPDTLALGWNSRPGVEYRLQHAAGAFDWESVDQPVPSQGLFTRATVTTGLARAYFRVRDASVTQATHPTNLPGLVAFWDFQENGGDRVDRGPHGFRLREGNGAVPRVQPADGAPFGPYAASFAGNRYLTLPRAETGALDIHGTNAQVTVVAWLKRNSTSINAIAGLWDETRLKRQYCLFLDVNTNTQIGTGVNVQERVSAHVSQYGGPTPGYPFCYEVALGDTAIIDSRWICVAMTYDGAFARAYFDGRFDGANPTPAPPYSMTNPYHAPLGLFDGGVDGADFTVGGVSRSGAMGNYFNGVLGGVAVFDRALTELELRDLSALLP